MATGLGQNAGSVGPTGASSPRLLVLEVGDVQATSTGAPGKLIRTIETRVYTEIAILLYGDWIQTLVSPGDVVRVILTTKGFTFNPWHTEQQQRSPIAVDDDNNFFIVHPDTLISGTTISDSFRCLRKSVITSRCPPSIAPDSFIGEAALFGSMIHDLFQNMLVLDSSTRDYSNAYELSQSDGVDIMSFFELVEDIVNNHADELFAASISISHARQVLHKVIPQIVNWYETFMGFGNFHKTNGVPISEGKHTRNVVVTKVHDIEELVWSPVLGLKGKIDASVHLRIDGSDCGIAVLELKSGKPSGYSAISHNAQVSLYNLLLSDRNSTSVCHGLLTYISYKEALQALRENSAEMPVVINNSGADGSPPQSVMNHRLIIPKRTETIALIMQRNCIAAHVRIEADIEDVPPLLEGRPDTCDMCFASDSCLIQHKLLEGGDTESAERGPGKELFLKKTGHLTALHMKYYEFWRSVLADEEEYAAKNASSVWTMKASQKETCGKCLSNLVLASRSDVQQFSPHELLGPGQRTIAEFRRAGGKLDTLGSLVGHGVSVGDFVVVSADDQRQVHSTGHSRRVEGSETWQCALTNGFVQSITTDVISITVDRSLVAWALHQGVDVNDVVWRVDAEEIYASHNTAKRTLDLLFYAEESKEGMQRLRELVVDRRAPTFHNETTMKLRCNGADWDDGVQFLNEEQRQALELSFRAIDYLLILGMPGTGKTATLAAIITAHAKQEKSILICSHTNTAVDNLLRRLLSMKFEDFVRLGRNLNVIDDRIRPFHASTISAGATSMEELERTIMAKQVIATTCLGINHWVLQRRKKFDVIVIDEASQMLQPICIGPLQFLGGFFVLVGDHYQLPPLQRAGQMFGRRQARIASLHTHDDNAEWASDAFVGNSEESLFRRLCERGSEAMVMLSRQYRMALDIMHVCNEIVYGGSLRCATEDVEKQKLKTTYVRRMGGEDKDWLQAVRDTDKRLVFIDVRKPESALEVRDLSTKGKAGGEGVAENPVEAAVITEGVSKLVEDGLEAKNITVLTPFRAQVQLISGRLKAISGTRDCEVSTIDQYQGKDNKCVVVSFVKSGHGGVGPLVRDWRRLNVALTRAKQKLILVGCVTTLSKGSHVLQHLVHYFRSNDLIVCRK